MIHIFRSVDAVKLNVTNGQAVNHVRPDRFERHGLLFEYGFFQIGNNIL